METSSAVVRSRRAVPARRGARLGPVVEYGVLIVYALIVLLPLALLFLLSVKSLAGIVAHPLHIPRAFQWSNYAHAWTQGNLGRYILNTLWMSVASVAVVIFAGSLAAFAIGRYRFRGNQVLYLTFIAGLAFPVQMLAVPLYSLLNTARLIDNPLSLVVVYGSTGLAFAVFLLTGFARGLPKEYEEAAVVEGASPFYIYRRIALPLMRPILATVALFNFVTSWNGFFFPLILITSRSQMTVTVGVLSFVGQYQTDWQYLIPALIIVMLPPIAVFIVASRQFVRGLTAGGLKF